MISLSALSELAEAFRGDLRHPVAPLTVGAVTFDLDVRPAVMGCVNLSRDSTYRESVAPSTQSAVRKARVMVAQGADVVDVGAESSSTRAARQGTREQLAALVPVVEELAGDDVVVSVETYDPAVARACLRSGASMLNFTGSRHEAEVFELVAGFKAAMVLCYVPGADVRDTMTAHVDGDPLPALIEYFGERVERARSCGVESILIDPGIGFSYGNLVDAATRLRHQARILLNTFRLRCLGVPICHALPHAFDVFEDQFRSAEGFFAVLASLGGTGLFRTHEVPQVIAVLRAMRSITPR